MEAFFRHLALFLQKRRTATLLVVIAATALCALFALGSRVDNSLPVWQSARDNHWQHYLDFMDRHAVSDPLVVYLPHTDTTELHTIRDTLRDKTESAVFSLTTAAMGGGGPGVLFLKPAPDLEPEELSHLLQQTRELLNDLGVTYHLGGVWYVTAMLDSFSARSTQTLFPVVVLLLGLGTWVFIRRIDNVLLVLGCGLLPAVQIVGVMAMADIRLNMVLLALPPLTMILGTAYAIHLVAKVPDRHNQTGIDLFVIVAQPCLLSAITTCLGFLSLTFSDYSPVRQLGLWGVIATLLVFLNAIVLLPILFTPATVRPYSIPNGFTKRLRRSRHLLLIFFVVCCLAAGFGINRLEVGTLILDFFKKDSEVHQNYLAIEQAGLGLTPFELDLAGCPADKKKIRQALAMFARHQQAITHFFYFFGSGQVVVDATANGLPFRSPLDYDLTLSSPTRVTVLLRTLSSEESLRIAGQLDGYLHRKLGPLPHPYVTGAVPLYARGQQALFTSLLQSFGFAFLSISIIIGLALRSFRYGLLAIIPNILPVFFILAAMGWLAIPLSVSTVTVASIVFGIVVDDSIHFLHRLRGESDPSIVKRLHNSLAHVGPAIILTSLISGLGFLGFVASPFLPLRDFGLIIAGSLFLALICDLFLLPVLLLLRYNRS